MLIDTFAQDLIMQLEDRAEALAPPCQLHLLIDGAFVPKLHRLLPDDAKALLFESLPGCSEEAKDFSPFLTPFIRFDNTLIKLLKRCNRWPMVSVIQTAESLDQLAKRLAGWCVVEIDGQRFNLRFPDTRRLPGILQTLNPDQRKQIAGPAERWLYVSRDGHWREIELSPADAQNAIDPVLDMLQFASLVDDSRADEILALLGDLGAEVYRHPSRSHALVTAAMRSALTCELGDDELILWCESFWKSDQLCEDNTAVCMLNTWRLANEAKNDQIPLES